VQVEQGRTDATIDFVGVKEISAGGKTGAAELIVAYRVDAGAFVTSDLV